MSQILWFQFAIHMISRTERDEISISTPCWIKHTFFTTTTLAFLLIIDNNNILTDVRTM